MSPALFACVLGLAACAPAQSADDRRIADLCMVADPRIGPDGERRSPIAVVHADACVHYDPEVIARWEVKYGGSAILGVLLHEARHVEVITRPVLTVVLDSVKDQEADADWHSGCWLAEAGFEPDGLVDLIEGEFVPHADYPTLEERVWLVRDGYESCSR